MRVILTLAWIMTGLLAVAFHFGPGQNRLKLDQAAEHLSAAKAFTEAEAWGRADAEFKAALVALPSGHLAEKRRIQVERSKALLNNRQLPEAYMEMSALVEKMNQETGVDSELLADAQSTLASSRYYLTWLMRLEGLPRDAWEEDIEAARQTYRHLAEQAAADGRTEASVKYQEDMESAILLGRMDLEELQGLTIPKQCQGCCSSSCKKPNNKVGKKRKKDARGASSGPPPDNGGS